MFESICICQQHQVTATLCLLWYHFLVPLPYFTSVLPTIRHISEVHILTKVLNKKLKDIMSGYTGVICLTGDF